MFECLQFTRIWKCTRVFGGSNFYLSHSNGASHKSRVISLLLCWMLVLCADLTCVTPDWHRKQQCQRSGEKVALLQASTSVRISRVHLKDTCPHKTCVLAQKIWKRSIFYRTLLRNRFNTADISLNTSVSVPFTISLFSTFTKTSGLEVN